MRVPGLLSSFLPIAAAAVLVGAVSATAQEAPQARVVVGSDTIVVEVADEYPERVRGLRGRTSLEPGTGMLFVWDTPDLQSFWMRGTPIDLDIAFIDESLTIVKVATMQAESEEFVESGVPVPYALEVPAGWFAERGIERGTSVRILRPPEH